MIAVIPSQGKNPIYGLHDGREAVPPCIAPGMGSSFPLGVVLPGKPVSLDAADACPSSVSGSTMHAALWPWDSSVATPPKNFK